jgi:hypothetical protein
LVSLVGLCTSSPALRQRVGERDCVSGGFVRGDVASGDVASVNFDTVHFANAIGCVLLADVRNELG